MNSRNTEKLSHPYFENLNGLRAIGALSVFVFHAFLLGHEVWGDFYDTSIFQIITKVASKGNYGVSLFFVLSGFLITYLLLNEAKQRGTINVFSFFMRRLIRIWPVYFIVIIFGFVIFPHIPFGIQTTNSPWYYGFFLSNFEEIRNGFRDPVNFLTITWSVSIEEQFYMAWVALMALLPFMRKGKGFLPYMILLVVGSIVFRILNYDQELTLYYHTFAVMSDLAIGGLLAYFCFHKGIQDKFSNMPGIANVFIYSIGIGAVIGARFIFPGGLIVVEKAILGLFFAYVIFDQAFGKNSLFKVDTIPGLFKLGEISYGFYMYHCIILYYVLFVFGKLGWTAHLYNFIIYLILSLALTIVVSSLSYRFIEKPILNLKKRFQP